MNYWPGTMRNITPELRPSAIRISRIDSERVSSKNRKAAPPGGMSDASRNDNQGKRCQ